jgi:aspartate/methionine/tyrosine aminotransferase
MNERASRVSGAVGAMTVSAIKEMAFLARAYDDVAQLTWGLPSFQTPPAIREALAAALAADPEIGKYTMPDGLPVLRAAAADAHAAATGQAADPDREVLVTAGNIEAMNALLHVLLDPGD